MTDDTSNVVHIIFTAEDGSLRTECGTNWVKTDTMYRRFPRNPCLDCIRKVYRIEHLVTVKQLYISTTANYPENRELLEAIRTDQGLEAIEYGADLWIDIDTVMGDASAEEKRNQWRKMFLNKWIGDPPKGESPFVKLSRQFQGNQTIDEKSFRRERENQIVDPYIQAARFAVLDAQMERQGCTPLPKKIDPDAT